MDFFQTLSTCVTAGAAAVLLDALGGGQQLSHFGPGKQVPYRHDRGSASYVYLLSKKMGL